MLNLPSYSNCVLDIRTYLGSFLDWSGNSNHATPATSNMHFVRGNNSGLFVESGGGDDLSITHSSELDVTDCSLIWYGDLKTKITNQTIFRKANTSRYQFYYTGTALSLFNGTTSSSYTVDITGAKFIACTLVNGSKSRFFIDGVFKSLGNQNITLSNTGGSLEAFGGSAGMGNRCDGALIYNTALTDAQISQVYEWTQERYSINISSNRKFFDFGSKITGRESGLVAAYDMKSANQTVADKSGNGNNGTSYYTANSRDGLVFIGIDDCCVEIPYDSSLLLGNTGTVAFTFKPENTDAGSHIVVSYGGSSYSTGWLINQSGANLVVYWKSGGGSFSAADAAVAGKKNRFVMVNDNGTISLYKDTVQIGTGSTGGTITAELSTYIGGDLTQWNANATIADVAIYSDAKDTSWIAADYKNYARLPNFVAEFENVPVSISNVSSGYIEGTDFIVSTGSWKIDEDLDGKWLECVTDGIIYKESQLAYGTWEFDFYTDTDSLQVFQFIGSSNQSYDGSAQTGYILYVNADESLHFTKNVDGVIGGDLFATAASYIEVDTWYKARITRRYDGQFSVYIKGGSFTDWTLIDVTGGSGTNPITDNTITSSKYTVLTFGGDDRVFDFIFYQGLVSPL